MSDNWPSLQYLDDVDKGGVADMAGLKKGDFLLEVCDNDLSPLYLRYTDNIPPLFVMLSSLAVENACRYWLRIG